MKSTAKLFGEEIFRNLTRSCRRQAKVPLVIIVLLAIIGCSIISCDTDGGTTGGGITDGGDTSSSGVIMAYSTDGITWKAVKDPKINNYILNVAYGNGIWLASTNGTGNGNSMAYSSDGVTWTAINEKINSSCVNEISWGNGKFIAACNDGVIAYSVNGLNWANVPNTTFGSNDGINSVAWNGNIYIAVGFRLGSSGKYYAFSNDGLTWTAGSGSLGTREHIAFGGGVWIAGRNWATEFNYSEDDGNTWKTIYVEDKSNTTGVLSGSINKITYGNGTFVATGTRTITGQNLPVIVYSTDGKEWKTSKIEGTVYLGSSETFTSVAWGGGKFVAVSSGGRIAYSTNGVNWTITNSVFGNTNIRDIAWGGDKFVAVGYDLLK